MRYLGPQIPNLAACCTISKEFRLLYTDEDYAVSFREKEEELSYCAFTFIWQ